MRILGIETSCDETGAAVIEGESENKKVKLISNILASSLTLHSKTGGIIPETAAREQIKYIIPAIEQALSESRSSRLDAIAVTVGPGLIGSLLVGVETAKTLSFIWKKPIIPVNHLFGHIYANWLDRTTANRLQTTAVDGSRKAVSAQPSFPAIALVVSGGHTDLVLIKNHGSIKWLGGTRDDAAGEAFDKIGRILNLPYPGGPAIEKAAEKGNPKAFKFPRPLIDSDDFDFSFSGLKTAVFREVARLYKIDGKTVSDISLAVEEAIVDVLIYKTLKAAQKYKVKSILLGGGVAANQKLRDEFQLYAIRYKLNAEIFVPSKNLCTDNAAMIAAKIF